MRQPDVQEHLRGGDVDTPEQATPKHQELSFCRPAEDTLLVCLAGSWLIQQGLVSLHEVQQQLNAGPPVRRMTFDTWALTHWDSALLTFLHEVITQNNQRQITTDQEGLPVGVQHLLALAIAAPERPESPAQNERLSLLAQIGMGVRAAYASVVATLTFLGETWLAAARMIAGQGRFQRGDVVQLLSTASVQALPIVSLISFLVGMILAFTGALQLQQFGAQLYVADLVGLGMAREMAAVMTAFIMAGRTGAAFAARLGTMQVNEEIDALITTGISPMAFLVGPRLLVLVVMLPLLSLYANLLGIVGGGLVAVGVFDLSVVEYVNETQRAVRLTDFAIGLCKSVVFGALIAVAGCLRGMQCKRSAQGVGAAATSAVVTAMVWIVIADGIFAVVVNTLGI